MQRKNTPPPMVWALSIWKKHRWHTHGLLQYLNVTENHLSEIRRNVPVKSRLLRDDRAAACGTSWKIQNKKFLKDASARDRTCWKEKITLTRLPSDEAGRCSRATCLAAGKMVDWGEWNKHAKSKHHCIPAQGCPSGRRTLWAIRVLTQMLLVQSSVSKF